MAEEEDGGWHQTIILPDEILNNSPSRRAGISEEVEFQHRIFGCELIQEAGILLKSPQVVMATGQNLLQRFYYRQALTNDIPAKRFYGDAFSVAMGCLFLACKIEENPRRPRDVIAVFHRIAFRRKGLTPEPLEFTSEAYFQMKNTLFEIEKIILKELGFSFYNIMDHPHKFILYYIKVLQGDSDLAQKAWNYLNDSLRLDCCVRYRAELVACAAIYMAARDLGIKLPESPAWWELFGVTLIEIKQVGDKILSLYHQPAALRWLEPLHLRALTAEGEFYKLQKRGTRKEGGGGGGGRPGAMMPPSPLVVNTTPVEGTPAGPVRAKAEKTPETTAGEEGEEVRVKAPSAPSPPGSKPDRPSISKSRSRESEAARSVPDKSRSRERSTSKKHKRRSRSRSRSPVIRKEHRRRHDRESGGSSSRRRDRSRSRDRDHSRGKGRDHRDTGGGGGGGGGGSSRRRDRSRSRDRGSRGSRR